MTSITYITYITTGFRENSQEFKIRRNYSQECLFNTGMFLPELYLKELKKSGPSRKAF
jgi:hypothetical protein